jgi:hypothetical protein
MTNFSKVLCPIIGTVVIHQSRVIIPQNSESEGVMDPRIEKLVKTLELLRYTHVLVPEHWDGNWPDKRWFGFEDVTGFILQIVTANVYTRILFFDRKDKPFALKQYVSDKCPGRPKTDFYRDEDFVPTRMSLDEVLQLLPQLETMVREQEAA